MIVRALGRPKARQISARQARGTRDPLQRTIVRYHVTHGVAIPDGIAPESYTLDAALLDRPGNKEIQLDLFLDYVECEALSEVSGIFS